MRIFALLFIACLSACATNQRTGLCDDVSFRGGAVSVLFIGNSFTYYNNMPELFAALMEQQGVHATTQLVASGGATLADHVSSGDALRAIQSRRWDYVILQEQSAFGMTYLVNGQFHARVTDAWRTSAETLARAADAQGSRVLFLAHTPQEHAPSDESVIDRNYVEAARTSSICPVRLGASRRALQASLPEADLYAEDGLHPTPIASYLHAALLARVLGGRDLRDVSQRVSGHPVEENEGAVDLTRTAALVSLSSAEATALTAAANASAADALGLPEIDAHEVAAPRLPLGQAPSTQEITGRWSGATDLYPVPAALDLSITADVSGPTAALTVSFGSPVVDTRSAANIPIEVTNNGIAFTFPEGPNGTTVRYEGAYRNGAFDGIARFRSEDGSLEGVGTWRATR